MLIADVLHSLIEALLRRGARHLEPEEVDKDEQQDDEEGQEDNDQHQNHVDHQLLHRIGLARVPAVRPVATVWIFLGDTRRYRPRYQSCVTVDVGYADNILVNVEDHVVVLHEGGAQDHQVGLLRLDGQGAVCTGCPKLLGEAGVEDIEGWRNLEPGVVEQEV